MDKSVPTSSVDSSSSSQDHCSSALDSNGRGNQGSLPFHTVEITSLAEKVNSDKQARYAALIALAIDPGEIASRKPGHDSISFTAGHNQD